MLPEIVMKLASVPTTEYLKSLQYGFEYVKPPIAIFVFPLVGLSFKTVYFQALKLGFVIVLASLSQPYTKIVEGNFVYRFPADQTTSVKLKVVSTFVG